MWMWPCDGLMTSPDVHGLSPNVSWHWLQPPPDPEHKTPYSWWRNNSSSSRSCGSPQEQNWSDMLHLYHVRLVSSLHVQVQYRLFKLNCLKHGEPVEFQGGQSWYVYECYYINLLSSACKSNPLPHSSEIVSFVWSVLSVQCRCNINILINPG